MFADHFRSFAAYNAWANRRLYDAVAALPADAVRAARPAAYFGSILGTLNHVLVADRLWLDRIEGRPPRGYRLDTVLHEDPGELREAREAEDARIEALVADLDDGDLERTVAYTNFRGQAFADPLGRLLAHVFNHQTHHRGQAHALVKDAGAEPPPLDYIYFLRETG